MLVAVLAGLTLCNGYVLWNARRGAALGYGDYPSFYTAGVLLRRGQGSQLYDREAQWRVQQEFASQVKIRRGPLRYLRPAYEAKLFQLFARWPYPTSLLLWTSFKFLLLLIIPFLCVPPGSRTSRIPPAAVGILSLGTYPVFIDFLQGQDAILLTFLFAISYRLLAENRDTWAGVVLGIALFKFHLVVPFVVILWIAGRRRTALGFVPAMVAVVITSALTVGWREFLRYPAYLLHLNRTQGVGVVVSEVQMNFRGLLTLFVGRSPYPGPIHWILLPIALAVIAYAGWTWRRAGSAMLPEGFALALTSSILGSYYAYAYDLSLLGIPLLAMWARDPERPMPNIRNRVIEATPTALLLFTPLYWFLSLRFHAQFLMAVPLLTAGVVLAYLLRRAAAMKTTASSSR